MYVIQKGQVEVVKEEDGHQIQLRVLHQGDVFGEMAIFEKEVRSAGVRPLGEAQVLTIDKKTFLRRVKEDPSLAFNILKVMSERLRKLNSDVMQLKKAADQTRKEGDL
jgi:CRP-like cAMP-binding protein